MPALLVIGALAAAAVLAAKLHADARRMREFRAENGWSLEELAGELTRGYDADRDGRLTWNALQGVRALGESARTTVSTWTEPLYGWGVPSGTRVVKERRTTWTIAPLLRESDADQNGVVTQAELAQLLSRYDGDGNGRVTAQERRAAVAAYRAIQVERQTRTVGVLPPPVRASRP